ncbi:MalY/PatB family protein [Enterococcus sp. LJL128]|uniref:MalY/PatB family protein n=1 Tax=Enterococcus sp. LJL51 TaxID=3416656 RepID=UPI003CEE1086
MTDFDQIVSRIGTYSTQWDYVQDRFGEKGLLPFSISDMDFKIPKGTQEVLTDAVKRGVFGYTRWNHSDFKGAIASWFSRHFQTIVAEDWIVYSPSVIYSLSVFLQLLSEPGGKVVTLTPCYDAFFKTVAENKQALISVSLKKETGFQINFEELAEVFEKERPEIFLLCNPHNPTGRAFNQEELTTLIELCNQYQVGIISDEIHMDIRRKGVFHHPIVTFADKLKVPVVLLSSASKTFNSPGMGCSYAIVPDRTLRESFLTVLKNKDGLSSVPYLGMLALQDCYNYQQKWLAELNSYLDDTFLMLTDRLAEHPYISAYIPEASYLAWLDLSRLPVSMDELQKILIHQEKVAIMRGDTYGKEGKKYLRFNLGAPRDKISDGLERLLRAVQKSSINH